ncbi:unnamed protein product [Caretta caretta]
MGTSLILSFFIVTLCPGAVLGESIQSNKPEVSAGVGDNVTLSCSYNTSYSDVYLYWYHQFPDQGPQYSVSGEFLVMQLVSLRVLCGAIPSNPLNPTCLSQKEALWQSAAPTAPAIAVSLSTGLSTEKNSVTQREGQLSGVQSESVTLDCTFSTEDAGYDTYWYKQDSSSQTKYLFRRSGNNTFNHECSRTLDLDGNSVPLLEFQPGTRQCHANTKAAGKVGGSDCHPGMYFLHWIPELLLILVQTATIREDGFPLPNRSE